MTPTRMLHKYTFVSMTICLALVLVSPLAAQLDQDFNSGGLELWAGDVNDFIVNAESRLQLMAPEGGNSLIYTPVSFPDSLSWEIALELDFAPSTSNALDLWLAVDDLADTALASGYKLSIGETGSDDAIRFISVDNGTETLIASGDMGQVADAFSLDLLITKDGSDNWSLQLRAPGAGLFTEAFVVNFADDKLATFSSFGLKCTYTSTRTDKFYFDDIIIKELLPDTDGPELVSSLVIDATKIQLQFNEALDESSVMRIENYSIEGSQSVSAVLFDDATPSELCLQLEEELEGGNTILIIDGLMDISGNVISPLELDLFFAAPPEKGDLVINEILYDPISGNDADYVELINVTEKYLNLDSVYFSRANSSAKDVQIGNKLIMAPGQIIAFTPDKEEIAETFLPIPEANIVELKITNYVNDEGNVSVLSVIAGESITLDSLDYTDDFHSGLLTEDNKEGISLERYSPTSATNDTNNWFSASSLSNNGTPGYENSQRALATQGDEVIELENKVFSPDSDGNKDFMRLRYKLDKTGYVANIAIYDDRGRLETYLIENELLGTEGSVIWEGTLADGSLAPIGMYIIYYDIFHADGEVISGKKVCVLAGRLN